MQYIQGDNRHQSYFSTLEDQVATDNPVRLMDASIDKLDLQKLGFNKIKEIKFNPISLSTYDVEFTVERGN